MNYLQAIENRKEIREKIISGVLKAGYRTEDHTGDVYCFYCNALLDLGEDHEEDCAYKLAKEHYGELE